MRVPLLFSWFMSLSLAQDYDYVSECPTDNGFFADALQCDRYYECKDGEVSEHFCPDGLVFDETSTSYAKCGFPFSIDCTGREDLQPAQPRPGCPRQHGYFVHPDENVCNKFNFCVDGVPNTITCAGGLIFDPTKGQCDYSDQTKRPGCTSDELFQFQCPETSSPHEHSRHPDPDDCSVFFLCITGKARRNKCSPGTVFNPVSLSCESQDKVEGPCQFFFNETYLESLTTPRPQNLSPAITAGRVVSQEGRRRPSRPQVNRQPSQTLSRQPPQPPQEQIPQQLLDLQNFGLSQTQNEIPSAPTVRQNGPPRARVPVGRPRPQQAQQLQDDFQTPTIDQEEKDAFFDNLRTTIRQRDRPQAQSPARRPFSRPPRPSPRPSEDTVSSQESKSSSNTGFGSRRRQPVGIRRRPAPAPAAPEQSNEEILEQVELELARRQQQQQQDNLGPAALESLLNRPSQRESQRRVPTSRVNDVSNVSPGRGRLQVLDNRRPPLQPQEEEQFQTEFDSTLNSFRQRNRG